MRKCCLPVLVLFSILLSCTQPEKLFKIHNGPELGIGFQNSIETNDSINALTFEYIYNGSGVGVGDFNNDGLEDLFFGGNQVSSRIYLNKGKFQFIDITEESNLTTNAWITGVSIVDIDQNGWDDIYLCVAGKTSPENRKNLLFINQGLRNGIPYFKEQANKWGLDDNSYSTMAAFFDYDKDGDLDMYLVNNWLESFNRNNLRPKRINAEAESTDNFYRNNGDRTFTDISADAGILIEGYGLGVAIHDFNQDSWPDVYVSNDFMSNDLLWINQKNGTFKNEIDQFIKHQSHNGMGMDVADFNNDELEDIIVVDMLPPDHKRQKLMTPGQNYDHFHMALKLGYQPQFMRNTLQLNRGKMKDGQVRFSEIAFLSNIAQTDWSWSPLFADFDNDGWKDLFIGNGYRKDVTDLDFIFFGLGSQGNPFGTTEVRQTKFKEELKKLPEVKLSNYIFRNTGTLKFEDYTSQWGVDFATFTNGAAYSDLDNDGDLDLITNNIDQPVVVYENRLQQSESKSNYVTLINDDPEIFNEKIKIFVGDQLQYFEQTPFRGFQSTVTKRVHIGLNSKSSIDSVEIWWPDSTVSTYYNLKSNAIYKFSKKDAIEKDKPKSVSPVIEFIKEPTFYVHRENSSSDIKIIRTLQHELSHYGPIIEVGDINSDGLDDIFIGGEKGESSKIFIQKSDLTFSGKMIGNDSLNEVGAAHFFDSDKDGDLDLFIGKSHSILESPGHHVLYINKGNGDFELGPAIPSMLISVSCAESGDFDGDGDLDLFVGGRFSTHGYPKPAQSFILKNNQGQFVDVTKESIPSLEKAGVVTSAIWVDINSDNQLDLVIVGEWIPIRVFINDHGKFQEQTNALGLGETEGWWNCVKSTDLNNDGFKDLLVGNAGINNYYKATPGNPIKIVVKDFDSNGSIDPVVTYFNFVDQERFLVHNRLVIIDQIPVIKKRFETFTQFATTPFEKAFTKNDLSNTYIGSAKILASCQFINLKGEKFEIQELPEIVQLSQLTDLLIDDLNQDGFQDIISIGNFYPQETLYGQFDASIGSVLLGNRSSWIVTNSNQTNFVADLDARHIKLVKSGLIKRILVANNNGPIQIFRIK